MTDAEPPRLDLLVSAPSISEEVGYGDAMAELEAILHELDDDAINVDILGDRVRRAAELIRLCRSRIVDARLSVERVVAELDDTVAMTDTGQAGQ